MTLCLLAVVLFCLYIGIRNKRFGICGAVFSLMIFHFFLSAAIASVCSDGSMFTFSLHSEKLPLGVDGIGDIGRGNWSNSSKE